MLRLEAKESSSSSYGRTPPHRPYDGFAFPLRRDVSTITNILQVALKKFIDDVSVLAVEFCLVKKLPLLFNPEKVFEMNDEEISRLAAENDSTGAERNRCTEKREVLLAGLNELRRLHKHRSVLSKGENRSSLGYYQCLHTQLHGLILTRTVRRSTNRQ